MANYLYNGVEYTEIPPTPDGYEGVRVIIQSRTTYGGYESTYVHYCKSATASEHLLTLGAPVASYRYSSGVWDNYQTTTSDKVFNHDEAHTSTSSLVLHIWTDTDILNADGSVKFAASDPVPVTAFVYDKTSFLAGLACGLCGRGIGVMAKAYLYNGIELPAIPAYDKAVYPYAHIVQDQHAEDTYHVFVTDREMEYDYSTGYIGYHLDAYGSNSTASDKYYRKATLRNNGVQVDCPEWEINSTTGTVDGYSNGGLGGILVWSNYKLTSPDGLTTPEPSEPIPVYE